MSDAVDGRSSWWLNVGIAVLSIAVAFMLYGLVVRFALPRVDPIRENNPAGLHGEIIQVEILNGCGVDRIASETRHYLRGLGFDVVEVGNNDDQNVQWSTVTDRAGDLEAAQKVANALGISAEHVHQDVQVDYLLDASVVIGKDYASLRPFRQPR